MADRDIISQETLLERFRELPGIERIRVRREERERTNDSSAPKKAGPYHNPQHREDIAKIALTKDIIDSDEYLDRVGLPTRTEDVVEDKVESLPIEQESVYNPESENGRPRFSRDLTKRKQKRVLPRSGDAMTATLWALEAQNKISDIISPIALAHFDKKNVRSLNKAEVDQLEYLKMCILTGMEPYMEITPETVKALIDAGTKPSEDFNLVVAQKVDSFTAKNSKSPNNSEMKYIHASALVDMFDFAQ